MLPWKATATAFNLGHSLDRMEHSSAALAFQPSLAFTLSPIRLSVPVLCLTLAMPAALAAPADGIPSLSARDVVNAADYSHGGVAPGEVVILYPSNAGPSRMVPWGLAGNLNESTTTGDTRVLFDGRPAIVIYSSKGQIGAIVPSSVAGKPATEVVVEFQGERSAPATLPVVDSSPAIFTLDATGKGPAAMLNETGCCNSIRNPAPRGSCVSLYATGEGRIPLGRVAPNISVTVGGVLAQVILTENVGSLQVNFRVPGNAPIGDAVPLVLTVGNRHSSPAVTMAVRSAKQNILVMDQDPAIRRRLARILAAAGYEVATAQATQRPDLVILNLEAPGDNAVDRLAALREARPRLRTLAISSALDPTVLRQADLWGAQAIVTKPLGAANVLARVRTLLEMRAAVY